MSMSNGGQGLPLRVFRTDHLQSIAYCQGSGFGSGWFVLVDPAGPYRIDPYGQVGVGTRNSIKSLVTLFSTLLSVLCLGGVLAILPGTSGIVELLIILAVCLPVSIWGMRDAWKKYGERSARTSQKVQDSGSQAWRICDIVLKISQVGSWVDRTVDPGRRVPSILWTAVERSLLVDEQQGYATRALGHDSLSALARERLAQVERERSSLNAIEANLREVCLTAQKIDNDRARVAAERKQRALRRREEEELRRHLADGSPFAGAPLKSDDEADRSAGVAAEAEEIARLLRESDQLLRGLD